MRSLVSVRILFGVGALIFFCQQGYCQAPYRPQPLPPSVTQPTLSPWLDLFRRNDGVLPNYQQFETFRTITERFDFTGGELLLSRLFLSRNDLSHGNRWRSPPFFKTLP
jgi:hypothetical protein